MKRWIDQLHAPVDPARFLAMSQVYQDAASVPLPTPERPGLYLTDMPLNRGMLAVVAAMRSAGASQEQLTGTMGRLMLMAEIFSATDKFGQFIRPGREEDGSIEVADALLMAAAVGRIMEGEVAHFDLDDVLLHARHFAAAEEAEEGGGERSE